MIECWSRPFRLHNFVLAEQRCFLNSKIRFYNSANGNSNRMQMYDGIQMEDSSSLLCCTDDVSSNRRRICIRLLKNYEKINK